MCMQGHTCLWQIEGDFKAILWWHLFSGSLNSNGRENESKTTPTSLVSGVLLKKDSPKAI